ncbi:MAG: FAD-dependent oxidoreductase, partial [Deltaproteobacteria bacterium]|nr:FAD-dependent oxidoreductase [Deltaproteobacteria bacterium]
MKKILILGSGAGGTMVAVKLRKLLSPSEWQITIIDNDEMHHYQPGWLFIPFGIYTAQDCMKPKRDFIPKGVNFIFDEVVGVNPASRKVDCKKGSYEYDWLVVASGCRIAPEEVEGLEDWTPDPSGKVHSFFTLDSALALQRKMKYLKSGKLIFNIAEMPHKCPVVPIEFIFMADWFYQQKGVRDNIEIKFVTPNTGVFTKPIATKVLSAAAEEKGIKVTTGF